MKWQQKIENYFAPEILFLQTNRDYEAHPISLQLPAEYQHLLIYIYLEFFLYDYLSQYSQEKTANSTRKELDS